MHMNPQDLATPPHRTLWDENRDLVRACLEHPFVRGLGDGSLDRDAFRRYVAQDAFFLRAFLGAYALAAARSHSDPARVRRFVRLLDGALEELELHAGYAARLGIDLQRVEPFPATSAYTDFLTRVAWTGEADEIVAAMTPCMRLYAHLGAELADRRPSADNPYRHWIDTYSADEFEALARELEALLDDAGEPRPAARSAYRYALRCELAFFDAPLAGGDGG